MCKLRLANKLTKFKRLKIENMKKIILISITFIFLGDFLLAQDLKKGYKQYEKGSYEKALENIMPMYKANKFNAAASFGLALIYSAKDNPQRDLQKAYNYNKFALRDFRKLKKKYTEGLDDYLTEAKFQDNFLEIDKELFEKVKQSKDYEQLSEFIANSPESQFYSEALSLRYRFEIETAKKKNTVEAFDSFIKKNPYSEYLAEAKDLRNNLAFEKTKEINTEKAYKDFVATYPKAKQIAEIPKLMEKAAYEETKKKNNVQAYSYFLETYKGSAHTEEINKRLEEVTFGEVKNLNSLEAYNEFLTKITSGKLYNQTFDLKSEHLGATYQEVCTLPSIAPYWVKVFDDNNRNDRSTSLTSDKNGNIFVCGYSKKQEQWFNDGWVAKINKDGKLLWDAKITGAFDDMIMDVAVDDNDNVWVTGNKDRKFRADMKFAFVGKYSTDGKKKWSKKFDGSIATAIKPISTNEAIVAGYTDQTNGNRTLWVMRVDANGNKKWRKEFPKKGEPREIEILNNGSVLVISQYLAIRLSGSGSKLSEMSFQDNYKAYSSQKANDGSVYVTGRYYSFKKDTKSDYWLMKLNAQGSKVWSKIYNRADLHDIATSVIIKSDGNMSLYGLTSQETDEFFDDIWVAQLDKNGNLISEEIIGSNDNEKNPKAILLPDGAIALFGSKGYLADNFLIKMKR